jgi:hypothetical protein
MLHAQNEARADEIQFIVFSGGCWLTNSNPRIHELVVHTARQDIVPGFLESKRVFQPVGRNRRRIFKTGIVCFAAAALSPPWPV